MLITILIMSAALPCIGALTAFALHRHAPLHFELISLSSDDDLIVYNRFRVQIQFALWMYDFNLDSLIIGFNQISALFT
jgi:hypothetical protein